MKTILNKMSSIFNKKQKIIKKPTRNEFKTTKLGTSPMEFFAIFENDFEEKIKRKCYLKTHNKIYKQTNKFW